MKGNRHSGMKNLGIALLMILCCYIGVAREAKALACSENFNGPHCWCKIRVGCTGYIVHDFGALCRYKQIAVGKNADCSQRCSDAAGQYGVAAVQASGAAICSNKGAGDWDVYAYSVVGATDWKNNACDTDAPFGKVTCTAIPRVCTCPTGWTCNGCSPQVDGGITSDGKCKKVVCQANTTEFPYPPDGTPIGTWGFSWGNAFIAWGTAANGGAPTCTGGGYNATWH